MRHVRLLPHLHHLDGRVGLGGQDVDDGVGVAVEGDGGVGLEEVAVEGAQDADAVGGAGGGGDDAVVVVDDLVW